MGKDSKQATHPQIFRVHPLSGLSGRRSACEEPLSGIAAPLCSQQIHCQPAWLRVIRFLMHILRMLAMPPLRKLHE